MRAIIRPFAVALSAIAVLSVAGPAAASCCSVTHTDPNDVSGKLDLSSIGYAKAGVSAPMRVTVRTYPTWPSRLLQQRSGNRLRVVLDVDPDPEGDYVAAIRFRDGHLLAFIRGEGDAFEPTPVRRPNRRTARFTIPQGAPANPNHGGLGISARSRFIASPACDPASGGTICVDRAPD
jgi:hypothetical protein